MKDGDDEQIIVDLTCVPTVEKIIPVTIHETEGSKVEWYMLYWIVDENSGQELIRYDLRGVL